MASMDCQFSVPDVQGLEAGKLTVGRHVILNCHGEWPEGFSAEKALLKSAEKAPYAVKLLNFTKSAGGPVLDMTFYTAGEHSLSDLTLTDGSLEVQLSGPKVKFESVLQPSPDGKPQEPFGSIAPIRIHTPGFYYVLLAAVLLTVILWAVLRFRRLAYFRQLKLKLRQYNSPLSPDTQFYKSVRQAEKLGYPLDSLEKAFRLYALRSFDLPMFDLPDARIIRYFKRNHPGQKNARAALQRLLGDFEERQRRRAAGEGAEERNEFVKKLYRFVDTYKGPQT